MLAETMVILQLSYDKRNVAQSSRSKIENSMRMYCINRSTCRRKLLMCHFDYTRIASPNPLHLCCDICACSCTCTECAMNKEERMELDMPFQEHQSQCTTSVLTRTQYIELTEKLQLLRDRTCAQTSQPTAYLLVGAEVCTGLSDSMIERIITHIHSIKTQEDLLKLGVTYRHLCVEILTVLDEYRSASLN